MVEILSKIFIIFGSVLMLTSAIGYLRMPDVYTKAHAASIGDLCGLILVIIGAIIKFGINFDSFKLLLLIIILFITLPTGTYIIAQTAFKEEIKPEGELVERNHD